jgi:hypothetical protein
MFVPSLVKTGPVVLDKIFLNDPTPFFKFCYYLPFEEDQALQLNKFKFPSPMDN